MCLFPDLLDLLSHTTTPASAWVLGSELRFWNLSGKHTTNESSSWPPEGAVLWLTHVSSVLSHTRSPHTRELLADPSCTLEFLANPGLQEGRWGTPLPLPNHWQILPCSLLVAEPSGAPLPTTHSPICENQQWVDSRKRSSRCWGKENSL